MFTNVKDTSAVAMFKIVKDEKSSFVFSGEKEISFVHGQLHLGPYHLILLAQLVKR